RSPASIRCALTKGGEAEVMGNLRVDGVAPRTAGSAGRHGLIESGQAAPDSSPATYALPADAMTSATTSGWDTTAACDAPAISRVPRDAVRSPPARNTATGMLRSWSPYTCQEGMLFHAGCEVGSASERAASVTGRCVAAMSAATSSETSA